MNLLVYASIYTCTSWSGKCHNLAFTHDIVSIALDITIKKYIIYLKLIWK